mgnify:CR=1 FL=1
MSKHTVNIEDVEDYRVEHLMFSQYGKYAKKKVEMIVTSKDKFFEVTSHGKVVLTCNSLTNATIEYNKH